MLNDILGALNWIALVAVIAAGPMTYSYFIDKKIPKPVGIFSGLIVFAGTFLILFFLYRSVGFPFWMRWPNELVAVQNKTEVFENPGNYRINPSGWQHNSVPNGDVFTCSDCKSQIQVQIVYGPALEEGAKFKNNKEFISLMSQPVIQKEFSDSVLRSSIPPESGITLSIERTAITKIGGIEVLQYSATVETPPVITHETSMIAVHKGRIMKLTLNFYDGAMNDAASKKVNSLFSSLQFL